MEYQGGKRVGQLNAESEQRLDEINEKYLDDVDYKDEDEYPDLKGQLDGYKTSFMETDEDRSGDIDIMELKRMMERLGQAKTHLELKKMIAEVDRRNSGTISYDDFVFMMLSKKNSILKLILRFEEMKKDKGVPPKRNLSDLP